MTAYTLPEPIAHMYPSDLERFSENETFATAFSVAVGKPGEISEPLFESAQMQAAYEAGLGAKPPLTFANERAQLEQEWSGVRKLKDALKARLRAAPEGYKLMPIKTTQPMRLVLMSADEHMPDDVYAALLAAAPEYLKCSL